MNENEYCLVSKELLLLLKWICDNEPEMIDKIVSKAWKKGFKYELNNLYSDEINQLNLQEAAFDFFTIMESYIKKHNENNAKKIISMISDKIDSEMIKNLKFQEEDTESLIFAFNKIKNENLNENEKPFEKETTLNKDIFLQEFLNNWEPKNKILN